MSTNISNKTITCNDKDAPWITTSLKTTIKRNSRVYRKWVQHGRNPTEHQNVRDVQKSTNKLIKQAKQTYFTSLGKKLSDPNTGQKSFWTVYKRIINSKKQTNIPPLIENDVFISNFLQKADVLNDFSATQCTIEDNGSTLPAPTFKTDDSLSYFEININQIINVINKFSPNKSHGHDGISVAMLQLCSSQVAIPLQMIFQSCISSGSFPDIWKYANVQPVHKKGNRQLKNNYRPISLLPICGKILEKIIFDKLYSFLNSNNLISKRQSGFRPNDSTIYQLISITSSIYKSFEIYDETRAVFLDISKAFDKVWHEGVIHKLKCNEITSNLLTFFDNYLKDRHQHVVLNGTESKWMKVNAGVPQGSVLGPLLFLVYINDLPDNIKSEMRLFADDSFLFTKVEGIVDLRTQ